jgi:hypothetical protein
MNVENELQAVIFQDVAYFQESNETVRTSSHVTSLPSYQMLAGKVRKGKFIQIPYREAGPLVAVSD